MKKTLEVLVHTGILAVPFVVLIVSESLFFPYITGKNFAFRILVEVLFASWVLLACYDKAYRPKFSLITGLFMALLAVMFVADIFGEGQLKSFWSNFERMEGYVTLVHVFLYFIVVGSSLGQTTARWIGSAAVSLAAVTGLCFMVGVFVDFGGAVLWKYPTGLVTIVAPILFGILMWTAHKSLNAWDRFFNVTLGIAVLLSWYALAQSFGSIAVSQGGGWRIDGTLGNSTYMAVYMLFHIFIAAIVFVRAASKLQRGTYGALMLTFVFILLQTGTRGAVLGLVGGTFLTLLYIAIFARKEKILRTCAILCCVVVVAAGALFVAFRDSAFVQHDPRLARVADISLEAGKTRFTIWSMALEGVKERPILGWGQSNFDFVFNTYYKPSLYAQETWFDRVHNIVLDWLIAGGLLGALCYFGIFGAAVWYIVLRPLIRPRESDFPVVERGILLGVLAGYLCHNLFVFDNIVSYIFFAVVLAYIHHRIAVPVMHVERPELEAHSITHIYAPVTAVILALVIYFVNVPGILAANDIIAALRATTPEDRLELFERALSRNSFGNQEIGEQMMQNAVAVFNAPAVSAAVKQEWFTAAEKAMLEQVKERPGDTRSLYLLATFYRMAGNLEKAHEQLAAARLTSPQKQVLIFEQGFVALQGREFEKAQAYFKEAYELAPDFMNARIYYAMSAYQNGDDALARDLLNTEAAKNAFADNNLVVRAFYDVKRYDIMIDMLERRKVLHPQDPDTRVNLAAVYAEAGNKAKAVAVLREAIEDIPSFKAQGEAFLKEIE